MDAQVHPETLEEKPPVFLTTFISNAKTLIEDYGWYLLALFLLSLYVWSKVKPNVDKWMKEREDREYAAKYHKDPDLAYQRLQALELARREMQEKYETDAAKAAERRKELEEKKKQEWLQRQSGSSSGRRLNELSPQASEPEKKKKAPSLRPDYNPLMGSGGSGGYRPPRRSCCPSGGCG